MNNVDEVKQVIIVRTDLNMPKGKIAAQVAHASMGVILSMGKFDRFVDDDNELQSHEFKLKLAGYERGEFIIRQALTEWLTGSFTKVCVRGDNEEHLRSLQEQANAKGLPNYLITDSGKTMFNGVPTVTCLAIGPGYASEIDPITGTLKLL